jgi:hypothetical protein
MAHRTEEARDGVAPRRWRLRPATYRRLTLLAALALAVIIVTGALVRLTGSGLGCPDWPECNRSSFVDVLEHARRDRAGEPHVHGPRRDRGHPGRARRARPRAACGGT